MKLRTAIVILLAAINLPVFAEEKPLHVFIRAGMKTHGPGEHDYPQFLADWKRLLDERGAVTDGALAFPTEPQLGKVDVMILFTSDGGAMTAAERKTLQIFTSRGGGLVVLHDGICGNDPEWFKTVIGGAKQHGVPNWHRGRLRLALTTRSHPITQGLEDFELDDELFHRLHLMPGLTVLATTVHEGESVPQLWCSEKAPEAGGGRAFVSLQGHYYRTFSLTPYRGLILRGIAWAGKRDAGLLTKPADFSR